MTYFANFIPSDLPPADELSRRPSVLIRQATASLQTVLTWPNVWYQPDAWCRRDGSICQVCFAGATILHRLAPGRVMPASHELVPSHFADRDLLYGLNELRRGKLREFLVRSGRRHDVVTTILGQDPWLQEWNHVLTYEHHVDPPEKLQAWCQLAEELSDRLAEKGL